MSEELQQDFLNDSRYFPLLTRRASSGELLNDENLNHWWDTFHHAPTEQRELLTHSEIPKRIALLQNKTGIPIESIDIISAIIREFILFKKDKDWLKSVLEKNFEPSIASVIQDFITGNILTIKPKPTQSATEEEAPKTIQLPLLDAMGTYPKIGEQTITSDRITVRGESGPVRGTVRNWLRAYRDALGVRKHTSMERGQFIFQSDNTRRLAKDERMRLSAILKSLDDKTPLEVHAERQEIQFQIADESTENPRAETNTFQPTTSRPAISIAPPTTPSAFQPVGNRLRIASARSQKETASAPETTEEASEQEESLSSAVYGDIASAPASEDTGFRFSANHILPHEKASALGIDRYRRGPAPQESAKNSPTKNVQSLGTDTFSTEREGRATKPEAAPSAPRKNFGNIVNLRDS